MRPDPYLNALRLIENFGRDLAEQFEATDLGTEAKAAVAGALAAMVKHAESQRAVIEMHGQRLS